MADAKREDFGLEAYFAAARRQSVQAGAEEPADAVDPALMARILGDAMDVQVARVGDEQDRGHPLQAVAEPYQAGAWRQLLAVLGGWPGVGGLVVSGLVGVWLAVSPPQSLSDRALAYWGGDTEQVADLGMEQTIAFLSGGLADE